MSNTEKLINKIYDEFKAKIGSEKAKKFISLVLEQAISECTDDNIAKSIHDAIQRDHTTFVKNKKVA